MVDITAGGSDEPVLDENFATMSVHSPTAARTAETTELRYMRQTRNATVFIAVVVGIVCVLSLVGVIYTAVQLSKVEQQISPSGSITSNSNCASQGGSDTSC